MFEEENAYIARATSDTSQMPTLILTAEQAEQVRPILDTQDSRKIGCIAVVNFGFDRSTGEQTVELSFACLEWSAAVAVCAKITKLGAAMRPSKPLTQSGSLPTRASMYAHEGVATEI
jgi:hypothetical protein